MYIGDGSYKSDNIFETSLKELILKEDDLVHELNEAYRAKDLSKKYSVNPGNYDDNIKIKQEKLNNVRIELKHYFESKLNVGKSPINIHRETVINTEQFETQEIIKTSSLKSKMMAQKQLVNS